MSWWKNIISGMKEKFRKGVKKPQQRRQVIKPEDAIRDRRGQAVGGGRVIGKPTAVSLREKFNIGREGTPFRAATSPADFAKRMAEEIKLKPPETRPGYKPNEMHMGTVPIGPAGVAGAGGILDDIANVQKTALTGGRMLPTGIGPKQLSQLSLIAQKYGISEGTAKALYMGKGMTDIELAVAGIGKAPVIGKIAATTKSTALVSGVVKKAFGALAILATAAGSMFMGQWGQAEAGEPITIVMKDILREAQKTGDYSLYAEAAAERDKVIDLKAWEKIAMWSPLAPAIGIPNKIKGAVAAGIIMDRFAYDSQIQQITGESDEEKWARVNEDKAKQEVDLIDYYNEQRKQMVLWEEEAGDRDMAEDAEFWRKEREKQAELERKEMEAQGKFWLEYKKEVLRLEKEAREEYVHAMESTGRGTLGFGLL